MDLSTFYQANNVYYLPGTNHALTQGEFSNDYFCQRKYVNISILNTTDIISALENIANPVTTDDTYSGSNLRCTPFSFIADTNSTSYVLNTGSNIIILNDIRHFKVFHLFNGNIKVIGTYNDSIQVTGTTYIPTKSNYGKVDHIKVPVTVFVLSSPLNLLPSQLLTSALQNSRHKTNYSKNYDVKYIFNYKLPSEGKDIWKNLTIPIGKNKIFTIRTSNGYTSLFKQVSTDDSEWGNVSGAYHKITEDDYGKPPSDQPPQSRDNTRELHDNTREVHSITFHNKDLEPLNAIPIPYYFNIQWYKEQLKDPAVAMVRRKQSRLSTIHEQRGHLSFHRLKILARSGIIPK